MMACNIVGLALHELERDDEATAYFERAIRTADELGHPNRAAMYLINLASTRWSLGRLEAAKRDLRSAISVAEDRNYAFLQAIAQNNLASIMDEDGDTVRARALYEDTLDLVARSGYTRMRPLLLTNLAEAYVGEGLFSKAEELLTQAERALPQDHQESVPGAILDVRGRIQLAAGDVDAAESTLHAALAFSLRHIHDKRHLKILVHLAAVRIAKGRHREALAIVRAVRPRARHLRTLNRTMDAILDAIPTEVLEANGVDVADTRIGGMRLAEILGDGAP